MGMIEITEDTHTRLISIKHKLWEQTRPVERPSITNNHVINLALSALEKKL